MYPQNDYSTLESPNPYVLNVSEAIRERHLIINEKPNRIGVAEFFLFLFKTDVFFFNWIEDVSVKRLGKVQALMMPFFIFMTWLFRKKIVWVLHNVYSHEKKNKKWTRYGFRQMIRNADIILTHSLEGVEFAKREFPKHAKKVKYIIHPIDELLIEATVQKEYDILIWGTIHPYKGVIEFLEFATQNEGLNQMRILVSGICPHPELKERLFELLTPNIEYRDGFFDIEDISEMTTKSRYTLFTYNSGSILSSGSLMDSIRMGAMIIGPDKGSFRDLKSEKFIETYSNLNDIARIIAKYSDNEAERLKEQIAFCERNSWKHFGNQLFDCSEGVL